MVKQIKVSVPSTVGNLIGNWVRFSDGSEFRGVRHVVSYRPSMWDERIGWLTLRLGPCKEQTYTCDAATLIDVFESEEQYMEHEALVESGKMDNILRAMIEAWGKEKTVSKVLTSLNNVLYLDETDNFDECGDPVDSGTGQELQFLVDAILYPSANC